MATPRVKTMQTIHSAYQVANDQISRLQVKDAQLHSTISNLREKIQSNLKEKTCHCCKVLEEEITLMKTQDQKKIRFLEQKIKKMETDKSQEVSFLSKSIVKDDIVNSERYNQTAQHKQFNAQRAEASKKMINKVLGAGIQQIKTNGGEIDKKQFENQTNKQQQKSFSKDDNIIRPSQSQIKEVGGYAVNDLKGHRRTGSGNGSNPNKLAANWNYTDKINQQQSIFESNQPPINLQQQAHQKQLRQQLDSEKIIYLLSEIQNYHKQIQNIKAHYQNVLAQQEHQKIKIVHELSSKCRDLVLNENSNKAAIISLKQTQQNWLKQRKLMQGDINALVYELNTLKINYEQKSGEVAFFMQQNDKKQIELNEVNKQLQIINDAKYILQRKISEQTEMKNSLSQKYTNEAQKSKQLKNKLICLQSQMSDLKMQLQSKSFDLSPRDNKEVVSLKAALDHSTSTLLQINRVNSSFQQEINNLKNNKNDLLLQISNLENTVKQQQNQISRRIQENMNSGLIQQCEMQHRQIQYLKGQFENIRIYYDNAFLQKQKQTNEFMRELQNKLRNKTKGTVIHSQRSQDSILHIQTLEKTISSLQNQKVQLLKQKDEEHNAKIAMTGQYYQQAERCEQLIKITEALEKQYSDYRQNTQKNNNKNDNIQYSLNTLVDQLQILKQSKNVIQKQNLDLIQQIKRLNLINTSMHGDIQTMVQKHSQQMEIKHIEVEHLIKYNSSLNDELQKFLADRESLINKINLLENVELHLNAEKEKSSGNYQNQKQDKQLLLRQLADESLSNAEKSKEIDRLKFQRQNMLQIIRDRQGHIGYLQTILFQKDTDIQNTNKELSAAQIRYEAELQSILSLKNKQIINLKQELLTTESPRLQKTPQAKKLVSNQYEKRIQQLQGSIEYLNEQLQNIRFEYKDLAGNHEQLLVKYQNQLLKNKKLEEQKIYLVDQLKFIKEQHAEIDNKNKQKILSNSRMQSQQARQKNQLIDKINQQKNIVEDLEELLKIKDKGFKQAENKVNQLTKTVQKNMMQHGKQKNQLIIKFSEKERDLTKKKTDKEDELQLAKAKFKDYQLSIQNLEETIIHLKKQQKIKQKQNLEGKKNLERNIAQIAEQKRKGQQIFLKEIAHLKQDIENLKKNNGQLSQSGNLTRSTQENKKKQYETLKKSLNESAAKCNLIENTKNQLQIDLKGKNQEKKALQLIISQLKDKNNSSQLRIKSLQDEIKSKDLLVNLKEKEIQDEKNKINRNSLKMKVSTKQFQSQLKNKTQQIEKIKEKFEEKSKIIIQLQQNLRNTEDHAKKIQMKYYNITKELTQKNLSHDFLWMQLQQQKNINKNLSTKYKESKLVKFDKKNSVQIEMNKHDSFDTENQQEAYPKLNKEDIKNVISSEMIIHEESELKEIQNLIDEENLLDQQKINKKNQELIEEKRVSLPMTTSVLKDLQLSRSKQALFVNKSLGSSIVEQINNSRQSRGSEIAEIEKKLQGLQKQKQIEEIKDSDKKSVNMMLHHTLSDALSDSEQNDEINEMISNKNSNGSKLQSSIGAFSEYSRIKSTQSEITHSEVEDRYKSKIKNSKLMAKLSKLHKKK